MSKATSLVKNPGSRGLRGAAVKKRRPGPANTAGHLRTAGRIGDVFRDSGDRYQSLFEQTTDAVILTDMESGAILEANPACAAMFGYPRESMKGMLHETLQPESRRNEYKERFCEHLKQAEIFTDDLVYRGADGGEIPVNITSAIFTMNGKRVVQNILRATAGLNSVVTKMMESEDKFSRAFHASPDAISISDLVDGTFIEINESYTKITGYTREEIIGKNAENFNMWATREDRDKMLEPLLRHEKLNNLEVNVRSRSGSINTMLVSTEYVQISGRPCLLVASTDITEYKLTKQALKESEEKFSATFQAIPESVSISRVSDGVFIDVNKNFCRQRGLTREQVIGHTSREIGFWGTPGERERTKKKKRKT